MLKAGLAALLSHWRRRPLQLALLLAGLGLATALWSGVQAINAEARASYARAAATMGQDRLERIVAADGGPIAIGDYVALRRAGAQVSPVIEGRLRPSGLRLMGVDALTLPPEASGIRDGIGPDATSLLAGDDTRLVQAEPGTLLRVSQLKPGLEGITLREAPALPPGLLLADIGTAAGILGGAGISYLLLAPGGALPPLPPALIVQPGPTSEDLGRLTDSFHLNITAFGFLAFAVGLFIVHAAVGLAFEQRRGVFRTLRVLGLSARALTALLAAELLVLALVAGSLGLMLGGVIAAALLPDVAATLRGLYGAEVSGSLTLRPAWWLSGLGLAVAGTFIAAAQSLWQVRSLPILASARPEAWAAATARRLRWQAVVAIAFLVVAGATFNAGLGLVAGFAGLAALVLGAALLLPWVLGRMIAGAAGFARNALAQWLWADTAQQLPRLSLALMALLLALGANIGVGTMVSSFRLTFTGWLDQRLAAELYITGRTEAEAETMRAFAAPRVDAVLPIWSVEAEIAGRPGEVYGVADDVTYRDNWPLLDALPDLWDGIAAGKGLLVNEQLARRERLVPGDALTVGAVTLPVLGIYSDYGNPRPQIIVSIPTLLAHFAPVSRLRYGLRVAPSEAQALARDLEAAFELPPGAVIDQAQVKSLALQVFERTFAVTGALNVLTLGIAAVAMLASLLTLADLRLPQLAPVWAMGVTTRDLARLELLRSLVLAFLTFLLAIPLGLVLAWVLLAVINVEAFGWRLPMHLFPLDWLRLGAMAGVAALLAAALPARSLRLRPPAAMLRVFADER